MPPKDDGARVQQLILDELRQDERELWEYLRHLNQKVSWILALIGVEVVAVVRTSDERVSDAQQVWLVAVFALLVLAISMGIFLLRGFRLHKLNVSVLTRSDDLRDATEEQALLSLVAGYDDLLMKNSRITARLQNFYGTFLGTTWLMTLVLAVGAIALILS